MVMNLSDQNQLDLLARQGLAWVDLLTSGLASEDDARAFEQWRFKSPAHAEALRAAVALRRKLGALKGVALDLQAESSRVVSFVRKPIARRAFLGTGIAAAAAYAVVNPPLDMWPSLGDWKADYRTGKGGRRALAFLDGVSIEMNTETSLAAPKSKKNAVELLDGEVMVTANRSPSSPFEVAASSGRVIASRAQFDVRREKDLVTVVCASGNVQVESAGNICRLAAGHRVSYGQNGLDNALKADTSSILAWRNGQLVFRDTPLSDAVDEINRYRDGRIVVGTSELAQRRINAVFQIEQIKDVAALIHRLTGAHITAVGNYVVLT